MNRRFFLKKMMLASAASLALAACAPPPAAPAAAPAAPAAPAKEEAKPAEAAKPAAEGTKLVIWNTGGEDDAKALQAAAELFTKENPGVTFDIQAVPWSDAHAKVLAAVTAGSGPDLFSGGMSWGIEFGKLGGLVNLKEVYPDDTNAIMKMIRPAVAAAIVPPSGEVYAVQMDSTVAAMFYRTDVLKELGFEAPPKDWDELRLVIEKAQAAGKKGWQIDWGNTDWLGLHNFVYSAGGSYYDAECSKATINSPEAVKALQFFAELYQKYKAPTDSVDVQAGLESGDYPIAFGGSWNAAGIEYSKPALKDKWGFSALPNGPSGKAVSFLGGKVIGILKSSKNADVGMKFLRFLYTPTAVEAQASYMKGKNGFYIPASADLLPAAKLPANLEPGFKAIIEGAAGPPGCQGWEESQSAVAKLIQKVIFEKADAQSTMDEAAKTMNDALKQ